MELAGPMTVTEFASKFGISKETARVWLSRMTRFKGPGGNVTAYLIYESPEQKSRRISPGRKVRNEGTYRINPKAEWHELYNSFC